MDSLQDLIYIFKLNLFNRVHFFICNYTAVFDPFFWGEEVILG